jgi:hypothetical protein
MPRFLALFLAAAALALGGCDDVKPPPGEVIGTFSFTATLDTTTRDGRCNFSRTPTSMRFDAVLSYEPTPLEDGSRTLWVQILGSSAAPREGRLTGTRFIVRSPVDPDRVPRTLDACRLDENGDAVPDQTRCTLQFAEFIGGDLFAELPGGDAPCSAEALAACTTCALGTKGVEETGGICGDVTEDVVPETATDACLCTDDAGTVAGAAACSIVYRLEGRIT